MDMIARPLSGHTIDGEKLSASIEKEMEMLHPLSDGNCIYRVPKTLSRLKADAYTPQLVSIGPLHHGKAELMKMEEHKRGYLQDFLRLGTANLRTYISIIKDNETRLRNCYAEKIELNGEKFVKMVLIDAAFVIMVLIKFSHPELQSSNNRIFSRAWTERELRYDMLMLENQIPFFVLEDLYRASNLCEGRLSMIELTREFFKVKWDSWVTEDVLEKQKFSEVKHFLDFLWTCRLPQNLHIGKRTRTPMAWYAPSATQLNQAGVKFELGSSKHKLEIEFKKGIIKIPQIKITYGTEIFLRNLQAFELCHYNDNKYISDYISLITMFVKTPKDVEMLALKGILQNRLRNDVCLHFTDHHVSRNSFYYANLVEDLNLYCGNYWNKWRATLKQKYFSSPWASISVITAALLLLLAFIQAICSLIQSFLH